jgi:hypothetical protein
MKTTDGLTCWKIDSNISWKLAEPADVVLVWAITEALLPAWWLVAAGADAAFTNEVVWLVVAEPRVGAPAQAARAKVGRITREVMNLDFLFMPVNSFDTAISCYLFLSTTDSIGLLYDSLMKKKPTFIFFM